MRWVKIPHRSVSSLIGNKMTWQNTVDEPVMDVRVHPFSEGWHLDWRAFVEAAPGATLGHALPLLSVITQSLGHQDRSLVAERAGQVCGVLPIVLLSHWFFGTYHVSLPWLDYGGILADDPETCCHLLDAAVSQARGDGASFIELRSVERVRSDLPTREDKVTLLLRLGLPESVWRRLDAKVRNQVRKAQRAGLRCQFGREDLLPAFYHVFARNMRDLGTPVWGMELFRTILAVFSKESEVAVVWQGRHAIAAGLTIAFKDRVVMPSASALREFRPLCPNNLLYWEVIKRASERGYETFDFGRCTIGSSTFQFKKQWGAAVVPLYWQYVLLGRTDIPRLNPSNPRFKIFIEAWKRLPIGVATWLGPRIVRHLP